MRKILFPAGTGRRAEANQLMIETRIDELLAERGHSFYWLAKETGISHSTLWRLKKGKALGINFGTLEGICGALGCQPGDVLKLASEGKTGKKRRARAGKATGKSSPAGRVS
jgi:putative transcriptional regulator